MSRQKLTDSTFMRWTDLIQLLFITRRLMGFILLLICCHSASGQTVSLATNGEYRPGEYVPLRVETNAPGLVRIRADDSLGIDWVASGKSTVILPWMTWRDASEISIEVNGHPQVLGLQKLPDGQAYTIANPFPPRSGQDDMNRSVYNADVYLPIQGWTAGRSNSTRFWIVVAAGLVVLFLAVVQLVGWRSRWCGAAVMIAGVAAATLFALLPRLNQPIARGELIVLAKNADQSDRWVYLKSGHRLMHREPWTIQTTLLPQSPAHLESLAPVLHLEGDLSRGMLELTLAPNAATCLLHRSAPVVGVSGDRLQSEALIKRFYAPLK